MLLKRGGAMKNVSKKAFDRFVSGFSDDAYSFMGCHKIRSANNNPSGYVFRVWAPNASRVSVVGDFNFWNVDDLPMTKNSYGVWEAFSEYAKEGNLYKYYVTSNYGKSVYKSDPYATAFASLPDTSSKICTLTGFKWHDGDYIKKSRAQNFFQSPVNIYELHLGSWKKHSDNSYYNYKELADELVPYVLDMGYTHIELLPIMEHPYYPSWGYQVTGYYAPTHRYGKPKDFMYFVDKCHDAGIGVILDWVPAHFPKDESGLYEFDGYCCYESSDSGQNEHPGWGTRLFDYSKGEVKSFLISSALFWFDRYHVDGIRVDAVANMLYLNYCKDTSYKNKYGGEENLEAIEFLKRLNKSAFEKNGSILMIAEEATTFPQVTKPPSMGGLGFNFKWNMGWMNDILSYMEKDPLFRKDSHNELTFSLTYAFSENFVLPLSHDEVVHGKKSILNKMSGDYENKFESAKVLYSYMMAHPGKKLSFMGNEFGQFIEWDEKRPLDWFLLDYDSHRRLKDFVKDLNHFYLNSPQFLEQESGWDGFKWISADDKDQSIIAFRRISSTQEEIICVINFCPVTRENYRIGLPKNATYVPVFRSDIEKYSGKKPITLQAVKAKKIPFHNEQFSGEFIIPPMSAVFYKEKTKKYIRRQQ